MKRVPILVSALAARLAARRLPTHPLLITGLMLSACVDQAPSNSLVGPTATHVSAAAAKDIPVSSQLLGGSAPPHSIQSDDAGAYQNAGGVSSILQGTTGDWVLDLTGARSTRKIRIDLTDTLPGNPSPPPFANALVSARFIAKAATLNAGSFSGMVGLGSTMLTPLAIGAIPYGGKTYAIRMNANNHDGTDWVLVTCIGVANPAAPATSSCNKWELTPTGVYNGVSKNVGYLEQVASTSTFIGLYYFTFDVVIAK